MGLRFRKSISIAPGVRLNFGLTGMSISAGVPGFRKTFHTSGRVTTSVGIPGTGLYYVDTKNSNPQSTQRMTKNYVAHSSKQTELSYSTESDTQSTDPISKKESRIKGSNITQLVVTPTIKEESTPEIMQIDIEALKSIHKTSDDSIDWTEVLISPTAPDEIYNQEMWKYYHSMAPKILSGDIDSYLQLIYEVNPLDDLLQYGDNFEFGTDDPNKIEVELTVNEKALSNVKSKMSTPDYNNLLQDYICSVCIRVARDMFALLPISDAIVHAQIAGNTVISVNFDRPRLTSVKFGYIDPSDTLAHFKHNMNFDSNIGFLPVKNIE